MGAKVVLYSLLEVVVVFVIIGSRKNKALVLDTKNKVVEECSWEECEFYKSHGFKVIGFKNSFRRSLDKDRKEKYSMHFDIEHQIGTEGMENGDITLINISDSKGYHHRDYKKFKGIRISGSLVDYTFSGDLFSSFSNKTINFEEMESMSYLQQVIFQDVFLYRLFTYTMKFYKLGKYCSISVDILHEELINESKMTIDGINYSENLLSYFRYVYGVLFNNELLSKVIPTFTLLDYEFFKVDFDKIKSEWEIFEYKNSIYFCDSRVCVWVSKDELINKASLARQSSIMMMKNKLAARVDGDFSINPSDGTIIVRDSNKVVIEDGLKYIIMGGSTINTIVIDTNNPNVSIKTDATKSYGRRGTIECKNIIVNADALSCDENLVSMLKIQSWTANLAVGINYFDYYFNCFGGAYLYFGKITFTGVDDKQFSDFLRTKLVELGIYDSEKIGIFTPDQQRFCHALIGYIATEKFNALDEDVKELIEKSNSSINLYTIFYKTGVQCLYGNSEKLSCNTVIELCNEFRRDSGLDICDYKQLFIERYPDISADS